MTGASIALGILAGGQGTRAGGVDKGWVVRDGCAQIERVLDAVTHNRAMLEALADARIARVLVSANRNAAAYADLGLDVVPDRWPDFPGPMAGIVSLLLALQPHDDSALHPDAAFESSATAPSIIGLLTVPVDHALLPDDYAHRMIKIGTLDTPSLTVACDADGMQPLFAWYPITLATTLRDAFERDERSIHRWQQARAPRICRFETLRFGNLNTPDGLAAP